MKNRIRTLVALLALFALAPAGVAHARTVDRIAAIVDDQVITLSEVEQRAAMLQLQAPRAARATLLRQAADDLVAEKLFDKAIRELALDVGPNELRLALQDVMQQNGFTTEEQLQRAVESQGLGWTEYRDTLRRQLLQSKLVNIKVRSRVKVDEDEVKRRYAELVAMEAGEEEVHASHILVAVPADASAEQEEAARQKAAALAEEARTDVDFNQLARERSDGPSRVDGGDLGWFKRGEMAPELERAAFALETGKVSEPVRSRFGWHVLKVQERRTTAPRPFAEVADQIRERLFRDEMEQQMNRYLDELRREAVISWPARELAPVRG